MEPTKKMLILNILDILRRYTDADHTLSQKDILDILENEYEMKAERKAVRRNIQNLIDMGYEIEYSESIRMMPNPKTGELEENVITSDYWLVREFTDGELRLLIDSLLFSKHIPYNQCKELVEKLESLSNVYFKSHVKHISTMPETLPQNPELFYTIETLDEAIGRGRKVCFTYADLGTDLKPHRRCREDGTVREYVVSPYQMAAKDGKYYLICNYDKYDDVSNYRIDRIRDIRILDEPAKPFEKLAWSGGRRLDLAEYMAEHIYMYASDAARVRFRIVKPMIGDVIEIFGRDVWFMNETDTHVEVSARVTEEAMFQFAKRHAPDVLVLAPERLVTRLREDAERTLEAYRENGVREMKMTKNNQDLSSLEDELLEEEAMIRMTALNEEIASVKELDESVQVGADYFLKLKTISFDQLWTDYLEPKLREYVHGMHDEDGIMSRFAKVYGYPGLRMDFTEEAIKNNDNHQL